MKKIIWLIVFSLITFQLLSQQKQEQINLKEKVYWNIEYKNEINQKDKTKIYIIDTVDHCKKITYIPKPKTYIINNKDVCVVDKTKSEYIINDRFYDKPTKHVYNYNFNGHVSGSLGINIADLNISKIRLEYEKLKEDHARLLAGSEEKKSKPEKRETLEDIYKKVSSESVADEFDIDEVERELKNELVGSVIETEVSPAVEKNLIIVNESDATRKAYMRKYMKERRIKKKAAPAAPPS